MATEIPVRVTVDAQRAERDIKNFEKSLDSLKNSAADTAKAMAAITGAAAAMGYAILRTINAAGDLMDASNALGVSAANLLKLQQSAMLAGVGADELNGSLMRLNRSLGEGLQKGTGPAVDALKRLNIPLQEIVSQSPDQQFKKITQELLAIQNPAERTALAMDLFGKQGPRILAVAEEMEKVRRITEQIGFGITDRELQALDEASDSVDQLRIIWDAGVKKAVAEIAPYIVAIVNGVKEAIVRAGGFEAIWATIARVLNLALNIMIGIATVLAVRMVAGAAQFAFQLARAVTSARALSAVLAKTPVGLISAGIAAAATYFGVDLVGAGKEFLDTTLDIKGAEDQINQALQQKNDRLKANNQVIKGYNEEQRKALEALDQTIIKLSQQRDYQLALLTLGEEEARVQRTIAEEREKLKKVGLDLSTEQENRLRQLIQEEELYKRIGETRKQLDSEIAGIFKQQTGSADEVAKAYERLIKLQVDYYNAVRQGSGQEVLDAINNEKIRAEFVLKGRISAAVESNSEELKLREQHNRKIHELDNIASIMKLAGYDQEHEYFKFLQNEKLRLAEDYNKKLEDLELKRIEKVLMAERSGMAQQLSDQERALLQRKGADERQQAIVKDRIEFEKKSEFEKAQFAIQQGATVFNALGAQNKRAFEAAKAFNIAQALMNTYAGATKALATYPWPFGLVAAAAAVASGLAQVAQIRAQTYSGRALGGPVMNNTPYIVGENGPELFVPGTTGSIVRNGDLGGGQPVIVNFQITANDTTGFDQLLNSRRGVITQIISDAMLERGQRSMV